MVRLKDIARHAGVTVMSVSKALRNAPDISESTKVRIRLLAQQMGYVPDATARSLRTRRTRQLGLIVPAASSPFLARVLLALLERSQELGYDMIVVQTMNRAEREEEAIRRLLSRRVDGMFVAPAYRLEPQSAMWQELRRQGIPVVILGHKASFCTQFQCVETDDLGPSLALTRHLAGLGHRRIAFLTGPQACPWAQERLEGYRHGMREAEMGVDDQLVFAAGSTIEDGEKAAAQLIQEQSRIQATAIQAVNDLVAVGAAKILLGQGLRVPDDFSIVGFGNILLSEYFRVPLTTVRQPKYRHGIAAIELMQKLLNGERGDSRRLPAEIVIRASTGPAGK